MNSQPGEPLEDLRSDCAALRERLREAETRLSGSARPPHPSATEPTPPSPSTTRILDQAIGDAASAAVRLMETALAEHIQVVSMAKDLQREIDHRLRVEKALRESEQRCRRILDTIGEVRWISTADWETILDIDPNDRTPPPPK